MRIAKILVMILTVSLLAPAALANGFKMGTVDMQKVLQTVGAGQNAKKQLEKLFKQKKKLLKAEEDSIKKLTEEYKKQSLVLNDAARGKKQSAIQERIMKLQQMTQQSQQEMQIKEQDLTKPILGNVRKVIQEMAEKKEYKVILEKNENTVLFSLEKDDLTAEIIKIYNSRFKG